MRKLVVDRYEGQFTVCEDKDQKYFAIETADMPKEATAGTVIVISDDGTINVDEEETKLRKERILRKQRAVK